jgi:hypothetical protein
MAMSEQLLRLNRRLVQEGGASMDSIIVIFIGGLVVVGLVIRIAMLNARLDGFREAQQQINNGNYNDRTGWGCLKIFAAIGFLTVCGLCFYLGLAT